MDQQIATDLMAAAVAQAASSGAENGIPVGAVIARRDGTIVGRGHNQEVDDGVWYHHAEVMAARDAGDADLSDCVLVTTVEPCWLCAGLVRQAGIPTVVVGRTTERVRLEWLRSAGVEVHEQHDEQSRALLEGWRAQARVSANDHDTLGESTIEQMRERMGAPVSVATWSAHYRHRRVELPREDVAVLVIDMQRGFCEPDDFMGIAPSPEPFRATIEPCLEMIELARGLGIPVGYTKIEYLPGDGDRLPARGWKTGVPSTVYQLGAREAELIPELVPSPDEVIIDKVRPGSFYGTRLEPWLTAQGVRTVVLAGVTTSICVETTAREAHARGYDVYVVDEATAETEPSRKMHTLFNIDWTFGTVCRLADLRRSWSRS